MENIKTNPPLPKHKVVALIKFGTNKATFIEACKKSVPEILASQEMRNLIDFDQIQIVGTVGGKELNELRFVKFEK